MNIYMDFWEHLLYELILPSILNFIDSLNHPPPNSSVACLTPHNYSCHHDVSTSQLHICCTCLKHSTKHQLCLLLVQETQTASKTTTKAVPVTTLKITFFFYKPVDQLQTPTDLESAYFLQHCGKLRNLRLFLKFTLSCMQIQNFNNVMSAPCQLQSIFQAF